MQRAYIVGYKRTPIGKGVSPSDRFNPKKAFTGSFKDLRPEDLAALAIQGVLAEFPQLDPSRIDDLILGCATPEAQQGFNMARMTALRAGLPETVPGVTVNRLCSSGLQALAFANNAIQCEEADVILAGGVESMSMIPPGGAAFYPNPTLFAMRPGAYDTMGQTAENVARQFGISRQEQDQFAFESHSKALAAMAGGLFDDEIIPVTLPSGEVIRIDENPRATSLEVLGKLPPAFMPLDPGATVTAGNSSPISDGATALLLMSERMVEELGITPLGRIVKYGAHGYAPELMGAAPIAAVPKVLARAGLRISDMGLFELNEAFGSQCCAVRRELGIPVDLLNVLGGAIATGHPLGCTAGFLTGKTLRHLIRLDLRYGLVTMCVGGGQAGAAIIENSRHSG